MPPTLKYLFILSAVTTMLTGCTPSLYIPNELNMPLPARAKSGSIAANISNQGFGGSAYYAIDSNIVILGNGAGFNSQSGKNSSYDIGMGYYKIWPKTSGIFEAIGGCGHGSTVIDNTNTPLFSSVRERDSISGRYYRIFAQTDFGSFVSKSTLLGFGMRISYIIPNSYIDHQVISELENTPTPSNPAAQTTVVTSNNLITTIRRSVFIDLGFNRDKKINDDLFLHETIGISTFISGFDYGPTSWPIMPTLGLTLKF